MFPIELIAGLCAMALIVIAFEQGRRYGRRQYRREATWSRVIRVNGVEVDK